MRLRSGKPQGALWGRETMTELTARSSQASGGRPRRPWLRGCPVGHRFVGTPRVGFGSSETGQNYRLGYSLGLLDSREGPAFELGVNAERRKHAHINSTEHALLA